MSSAVTEGSHAESSGAFLARAYDLDLIDDPGDLELYRALARRTGGPILELGVGTGRLAIPLASEGYEVTGVDADPHMLERAKRAWAADSRRGGALELVEADLRDVSLDGRFGLVILALNTLLLVGDRDAQALGLRTMAAHLRPRGVAVVDIWLPAADDLALYDGHTRLEWEREIPDAGERIAKTTSARHDAATATVTLTQWFDVWPMAGGPLRRYSRVDDLYLVGATELVALAEAAGMVIERVAGDHQMGPFGPGVERAVLLGTLV